MKKPRWYKNYDCGCCWNAYIDDMELQVSRNTNGSYTVRVFRPELGPFASLQAAKEAALVALEGE